MSGEARLKEFLDQEGCRRRRSAIITLVVGLLLAAFVATYLGVIFVKFGEYLKPKLMVDMGMAQMGKYVPTLLDKAETYAEDAVPTLMDTGKKKIIELAPEMRGKLEDYASAQVDRLVERAKESMSARLVDVIAKHKDKIDDAMQHFGDTKRRDQLRRDLEIAFEQVAQERLDKVLPEYLEILTDIDENLRLYVQAQKLSEEQLLERKLIILGKELARRYLQTGKV